MHCPTSANTEVSHCPICPTPGTVGHLGQYSVSRIATPYKCITCIGNDTT